MINSLHEHVTLDVMRRCFRRISIKKGLVTWQGIAFLIGLFVLVEIVTLEMMPQHSIVMHIMKTYYIAPVIGRSQEYFRERDFPFMTDEYLLTEYIWPGLIDPSHRRFIQDPFDRLLVADDGIVDLSIQRTADNYDQVKDLVTMFDEQARIYIVDDRWNAQLKSPYDLGLIKALYCDRTGYDAFDMSYLQAHADNIGGYGDTHYAMGLLMLRHFDCWDDRDIDREISAVAQRLLQTMERDRFFGDLYAERIVTLYWLGYGDRVRFSWIARIVNNQQSDGGFRDKNSHQTDPHTSVLSALALAYFANGSNHQPLVQ